LLSDVTLPNALRQSSTRQAGYRQHLVRDTSLGLFSYQFFLTYTVLGRKDEFMLIGDALRRCAQNYADKLAVKDEYGQYFPAGSSYTYGELFNCVNRLANSFLDLGLKKGDRVAVQTGSGLGYVVSLLALAKVGMIIAPIGRTFMEDEIAYQVNDSKARGFIADADIVEDKLRKIESQLKPVEHFISIGKKTPCDYDFDTLMREGSSQEPQIEVGEDDIATLIYTSGTTGKPKGTPLTHRNWSFSAFMWSAELGVHPYTRWLLLLPLHTSGGTGLTIASMFRGCSLFLSTPAPPKVLKIINDEKITFTQFSPTLLANVVRHPEAKHCDFSSIEHWFTSAAPISAKLLKEGAQCLGERFIQLFGTTETALLGTVLRPEEVAVDGPLSKRLTSIGRASLGYETKVVDDDGRPVKPGEIGELAIKGGGVAKGYWNKPDVDDFRDGWWYSGDLVKVDEDGYYYVVDRKKDMILSGGMNVSSREVEDVIAAYPAVNMVSVIGVPDEKWGEAVKAVIVLKEDSKATEEEIIAHCEKRLANYKRPKSVDFIDTRQMPMMGGGYKILKRELRDRYRKQYQKDKNEKLDRWGAV
jgi:acyl-CoA synthetase (AMP-forming)/AMP-acid ligase II